MPHATAAVTQLPFLSLARANGFDFQMHAVVIEQVVWRKLFPSSATCAFTDRQEDLGASV